MAGLAGAVVLLSISSMIGAVVGLSRIVAGQEATAAALVVAEQQRETAETRAVEAEEQRRLALLGRHSVIQGITEPLKKLADPDLARDPAFVALRHEIIRVAIRVLDECAASTKDDAETISFQIHDGLLLTADGDHPGTWVAYRKAIQLAERQVARYPEITASWDRLGQAHAHLGMDLWQQGQVAEAIPHLRSAWEAFRRVIKLAAPGDYFVLHHAAWFLIFCPEGRYRDSKQALELAGSVARLAPNHERDNPTTLIGIRPLLTLGLARYRCGDWAGARIPIEKSIEIRHGGDAYEGFTLAMILARLGEREEGLKTYKAAELYMRRNRFGDFELHFLRDEAAEALGLPPAPK